MTAETLAAKRNVFQRVVEATTRLLEDAESSHEAAPTTQTGVRLAYSRDVHERAVMALEAADTALERSEAGIEAGCSD